MNSFKLQFVLVSLVAIGLSACAKGSDNRPNAAIAGRYEQSLSDGSTDILVIKQDGSMSLELTRQVGGPGGISDQGVVPYPTLCRVKQSGVVIDDSAGNLQYEVRFVELADLTGLSDAEFCPEYVKAFNEIIKAEHGVRFTLKKSEYALVK